jgi:hypothetical protein
MLDAKWLELLKASGSKTAAGAAAFGLFLLSNALRWVPPFDPWMVQAAALGFLLCVCLAIGSAATVANEFFRPRERLARWLQRKSEQRAVREYIPHMTEKEREIIAYLLAKNQKMFQTTIDGGYAATLLARGIVRTAGQQYVDQRRVPFAIPDHLWDVLVEHQADFPYTPPAQGEAESHPWAIHWMAR